MLPRKGSTTSALLEALIDHFFIFKFRRHFRVCVYSTVVVVSKTTCIDEKLFKRIQNRKCVCVCAETGPQSVFRKMLGDRKCQREDANIEKKKIKEQK